MKAGVRKGITVLLLMVFLFSCGMVLYRKAAYRQAEEEYAEAEELMQLPDLSKIESVQEQEVAKPESVEPQKEQEPTGEPMPEQPEPQEEKAVYVDPYADALRSMDFTALREVNTEILGWIMIPNTRVSYPLLQAEDNDYYLKRTWRKGRSDVGSIFMECQNSSDLTDFHTIIYGHRMNNGSMFGLLQEYASAEYMKAHPTIYITDDQGCHVYEVFAAYEADVTGMTYRIGAFEDADKQAYIDHCLEHSVVDAGVVPTVHDRILTLSTCTGRGYATRWVVQGVLRGEVPAESTETVMSETTGEEMPPAGTEIAE